MKEIGKLVFLTLILVSCQSGDDVCCTVISTELDIKFENAAGENITNAEDGIKAKDLRVSYFIGGLWHPVAGKVMLIDKEDIPYIRILLNPEVTYDDISETRIEFKASESDIIKAQLDTSSNSILIKKLWYNNVLKWDVDQKMERAITIIHGG